MKGLNLINGILAFGFLILAALYIGASFFIPLTSAIFLATLVKPVSNHLESWGIGRIMSSVMSTFLVFSVILGLGISLMFQLRGFVEDFPEMQQSLNRFLVQLQDYLYTKTGFSPKEQNAFFSERSDDIFSGIEQVIQGLIGDIFTTSLHFLLTMVYLFLFLQKRHKYETFILKYLPDEKKEKGAEIIEQTTRVAHQYLWGRIQVMLLLGLMYIVTFLAFGVKHAILLTLFGTIITIIPYLGPFVSGVFPVLLVLISGENFTFILIFSIVVLIVQLIESYILEPIIIGSEVHLAPMTIIIAIIVGGMIWGIPGMVLFVPIFAIAKILSDQLKPLQPVGYLIGESGVNPARILKERIISIFNKIRKNKNQ